MGFNAKMAAMAAEMVIDGAKKGTEVFTQTYEKITDNKIKEKNHDVDNQIKVMQQKTSGVNDIIHTAEDALNTVSDIADKISKSVNLSRKTTAEIDEIRSRIDNEKKRIDANIENEKKRIDAENTKAEREHIEKMQRLKNDHEYRMTSLNDIIECIRLIQNVIINLSNNDPGNPNIQSYWSTLSNLMNNLTLNVSNQNTMLPFKEG